MKRVLLSVIRAIMKTDTCGEAHHTRPCRTVTRRRSRSCRTRHVDGGQHRDDRLACRRIFTQIQAIPRRDRLNPELEQQATVAPKHRARRNEPLTAEFYSRKKRALPAVVTRILVRIPVFGQEI